MATRASASIEHRHAERGCLQPNSASLVKGDPESSSGWRW